MIFNGTLYRGRNRLAGTAGWFTLSTTLDDIDEARTCGQWALLAASALAFACTVLLLLSGSPATQQGVASCKKSTRNGQESKEPVGQRFQSHQTS